MKVSEVMGKAIVIDPEITLKEAAEVMSKKSMASVIVVKDGKIKGYVSEKDILGNLNNLNSKVEKSMSKKIVSIDANADVSEAAKLMAENMLRRLPVVKNGKLVGAVSLRDVIRYSGKSSGNEYFFN